MLQYDLEQEAQEYFCQLKKEYPLAVASYNTILSSINTLLTENNFDSLSSIISYIEEGEGLYAFNYIGATHRLLRILYILQLETKYFLSAPFILDCNNTDDLMNKYVLTLFALRRILFNFTEESVTDAIAWLQQNSVSYIAVQIITQSEHINPNNNFYSLLNTIYPGAFDEQT